MNLIKCDRCGADVNKTLTDRVTENLIYVYTLEKRNEKYIEGVLLPPHDHKFDPVDLCHECCCDLYRWMKEGKNGI